jgi:hypothetical protein
MSGRTAALWTQACTVGRAQINSELGKKQLDRPLNH